MSIATYSDYSQAKAAHDGLVVARGRALRDNEVMRAQSLREAGKQHRQIGLPETADLRINSAANTRAAEIGKKYDPQITSLYTQMQGLKNSQKSGSVQKAQPVQRIQPQSSVTWGPGIDRSQSAGAATGMPSDVYYRMFQQGTQHYDEPYVISTQTVKYTPESPALGSTGSFKAAYADNDAVNGKSAVVTTYDSRFSDKNLALYTPSVVIANQFHDQVSSNRDPSYHRVDFETPAQSIEQGVSDEHISINANAKAKRGDMQMQAKANESMVQAVDEIYEEMIGSQIKTSEEYQKDLDLLTEQIDELEKEQGFAFSDMAADWLNASMGYSDLSFDGTFKYGDVTEEINSLKQQAAYTQSMLNYAIRNEAQQKFDTYVSELERNMNTGDAAKLLGRIGYATKDEGLYTTQADFYDTDRNEQEDMVARVEWLRGLSVEDLQNPLYYRRAEEVLEMLRQPGESEYDWIKRRQNEDYIRPVDAPYMTSNEIDIYNYLIDTEGKESAERYREALSLELSAREAQEVNKRLAALTEESEVMGSIASVPMSVFGGAADYANLLWQNLSSKWTDDYLIDYNTDYSRWNQGANTIRGTVMDNHDWMVGDWDMFDIVYGAGMSTADSLTASTFGAPMAMVLQGSTAAANTTRDIIARGGTSGQALWGGFAAGVLEGAMEYLPFSDLKLLKELPVTSVKRIFTNTLRSMGVNALEEGATEFVNILYDTLVNGDISNWQRSIEDYMAAGMSEKEARDKTLLDMASQVGQAMTSGAIGGAISSAGAQTMGYTNNRSMSQVFDTAYRSGSANIAALADSLYDKMRQGKADGFDVAGLQNEINYYNSLNDAQKLAYDLETAVVDGTASLAEQMAYKISTGEKLTIAELNRLNRNDRAVVELGKLLGTRLDNLNHSVLGATLNSQAVKNAKGNEKLRKLQEQ